MASWKVGSAVDKGKDSSLNAFKPEDCCCVGENPAAALRACQMPRGMHRSTSALADELDLAHSLVCEDPNLGTV